MFKVVVDNFFSQTFFSIQKVHHSFSKLKMILILMIKKEKSIEIGEFFFKAHFQVHLVQMCFWFENY